MLAKIRSTQFEGVSMGITASRNGCQLGFEGHSATERGIDIGTEEL